MQRKKFSISRHRLRLSAILFVVGGLGGAIGYLSQSKLVPPEAVAVLQSTVLPKQTYSADDLNSLVVYEPIGALLDKVVMPQFAEAAEAASKVPGLAHAIIARQYGGEGRLSVRTNSENNQIELRFRAKSDAEALAGITAISDEILKEASGRFDKARELARLNVSNLKEAIAQNQQWLDTISNELAAAGAAKDQKTTLILIRLLLESKMSEYPLTLNRLEFISTQLENPPMFLVSTAISKGLLANPYSAALLFALAGMGLATLLLPFLTAPRRDADSV